ncbi:conserved hypothetical protein [Beutenbergia cavernae DSM 12333]|uniref:DUF3039 domain-containing protein n=1 Tax=Beutenbergia cavernae (strain ATCC BAA-8 / DSM 12333 / CCUG 43141 / JCM 11478 / NBRC 16432 / NCIMB 13614 / HKI 0122) TaxID=471853 RepID=C5BY89_BEUC1|nr:DUF3039 domain-containing protein [Beutenbergia cavernae]ACQ80989.1 conserved hypothetical protein [Beutenbergia cavernae DSM 12333]
MSQPLPPTGPDEELERLSGGTSTSVLERAEERQEAEPGDHERFAHYVRKDKILASAMSGDPVIALCGKVWTPGRDPNKFPVCPACKEIYESLRGGGGGKPGGGDNPGGSGGSDA